MKSFLKLLFYHYFINCQTSEGGVNAGSLSQSFPLDLIQTSLVMLEAAIPAPHTLLSLQDQRDKEF